MGSGTSRPTEAAGAAAEAEIATRPARGTQEFAETYCHFTLGTPWFHEAWYGAYDNPDLARWRGSPVSAADPPDPGPSTPASHAHQIGAGKGWHGAWFYI
jgi:hypothetical protein